VEDELHGKQRTSGIAGQKAWVQFRLPLGPCMCLTIEKQHTLTLILNFSMFGVLSQECQMEGVEGGGRLKKCPGSLSLALTPAYTGD